jgi:hypothetical protein
MVWASALIVLACVVVLAVHARFIFNFVAGPVDANAAVLTDPGLHRYVRVTGKLEHSGVVEETSKRLGHLVETSREETAEFYLVAVDGRQVVVKVPRDFAGTAVEGRVVELPERLRSMIEPAPIYPWMIDAEHSYRSAWNLPLVLALVLLLPCVWWLRSALRRAKSLARHPQLANLASHGDPLETADRIEREMAALGDAAHVGPYWISPAWFVRPKPLLAIRHANDIAAIGTRARAVKNATKYEVMVWRFGSATADTDSMSQAELTAVARRVGEVMPWAVVEGDAFERRWRSDRASEEAAARARREG